MNIGQFGSLSVLAVAAAALCACASEEVKKETAAAPAPVAAAPARAPAAAPAAPSAAQRPAEPAARPAPAVASLPDKRSVYYEFDQYDVKTEFRSIVESNAKYLSSNSSAMITIEGNCDERGSREYNLALGQRRADSVKSLLKVLGVSDGRIETMSYGEEKPVAPGHDETSWSQNRRSDIVYKGSR